MLRLPAWGLKYQYLYNFLYSAHVMISVTADLAAFSALVNPGLLLVELLKPQRPSRDSSKAFMCGKHTALNPKPL